MLIEEEVAGNMSNKQDSKVQDKNIWKSLRTHILSRREKNKQGTFFAFFVVRYILTCYVTHLMSISYALGVLLVGAATMVEILYISVCR